MIIEVDSRNCDEAIEEIRKILISTMSISLNRRKHVLFYQRIGRAGRTGLFKEMSQNS